jgi:hypothetical protein
MEKLFVAKILYYFEEKKYQALEKTEKFVLWTPSFSICLPMFA